jgi:hypothetical protein
MLSAKHFKAKQGPSDGASIVGLRIEAKRAIQF